MMNPKRENSSAIGVFSSKFPDGLRVLVVDDNLTHLQVLGRMLQACGYQVTECQRAQDALSIIRENGTPFDIVLSDVHMPDMDGFKFLELITSETDLPVVMMSADTERNVVMENIIKGACDYLVKPVSMETIKIIWQHVLRKQRDNLNLESQKTKRVKYGTEVHRKHLKDRNVQPLEVKEKIGSSKDEEDEGKDKDGIVSPKKPRMVWTPELQQRFLVVVNQIGLKNAVPKRILELMNVKGLTRENVASHLQKFRMCLERQKAISQKNFNSVHSRELNLRLAASLKTRNYQGHVALDQGEFERSNTILNAGMPIFHRRNLCNYGMTESRSAIGQETSNSGLEQLVPINQSVQLFGNMDRGVVDGMCHYPNSNFGDPSSVNDIASDQPFSSGTIYHNHVALYSFASDITEDNLSQWSEHDFYRESAPNAPLVGNNTWDSSYEATNFMEGYGQDDHKSFGGGI